MKLEDLGYNKELETFRNEQQLDSFEVGRVISEHKERYQVKTAEKEYEGEIIGNLRFTASSRSDFPAVGDWVAISEYDENKVLIHSIFPRKTILERQAVGRQGETQIIASNIDYALIMQSANRDFNINRIERYLTICNTARVEPIIIINKIDLVSDTELSEMIRSIEKRIKGISIIAMSNESGEGIEKLREIIEKGKTYCLLGSSGVGKSTLLNNLLGKELMKTNAISESSVRGRHVTSHRELQILDNGGIIIDNPGMREVGIVSSEEGMQATYDTIADLSQFCRFKDCTHTNETSCAVIEAVENGDIEESYYQNYLRLEREKAHFESTVQERRQKDKDFGKMLKNYKKDSQKGLDI